MSTHNTSSTKNLTRTEKGGEAVKTPAAGSPNAPQAAAPVAPAMIAPMGFNTQYLFPFPGQEGAPHFDGKNITQFLSTWEDLTLGWPEDTKVKRIPPYCQTTMGKHIKMLPAIRAIGRGGDWVFLYWKNLKMEMLNQQKYTEAYL